MKEVSKMRAILNAGASSPIIFDMPLSYDSVGKAADGTEYTLEKDEGGDHEAFILIPLSKN